jgi:hypothetical protein
MSWPGIFAIVVGAGMIGQWTFSYVSKQIPELEHEPIRIWFHIAAEMATALCLIVGGIGILTFLSWGTHIFLIAMGMLFYTAIVSPGYFAQKGQWIWLAIFSILILLGVISIFTIL